MIPHHSCLDVKTITPFIHGSLFSLSIRCWNSDPQNFQTAKTKSKDTWEKVTQREVLWNITPRVEFSDPNYKLIQILYSQLWRISKIHKPGSLHNQPERSSIANEFVYTCMRIHVRYYPMGGIVRQDFSSVEQLFGFSKTTSGSRFWQFWTSENVKIGCLKV
jgi:hypothetical protein